MEHSICDLPTGRTHYELTGDRDGPVVVLIHGLTTPLFIWDHTVPALVEAGCRVLRYDLLGRGRSDKPRRRYEPALFDAQLWELVEALSLATPVDLVGLSMGGAIAVRATAVHPERVRRLALISPAGFPLDVPWIVRSTRAPILGEVLMRLFGRAVLKRGARRTFGDPSRWEEYWRQFSPQLSDPAYLRAILSTLRHMPLQDLEPLYRRVGRHDRPVLVLWGELDSIVPVTLADRVHEAIPGAEIHRIAEAGHLSQYERPEVANPLLAEFLGSAYGGSGG